MSALSSAGQDRTEADLVEPPPKHPPTALLECFSEILEKAGASVHKNSVNEVTLYLTEPLLEFHKGSEYLTWWGANNQNCFPSLANLGTEVSLCPTYICPFREVIFCMLTSKTDWHPKEQRLYSSLRVTIILSDTSANEAIACYIVSNFPLFVLYLHN